MIQRPPPEPAQLSPVAEALRVLGFFRSGGKHEVRVFMDDGRVCSTVVGTPEEAAGAVPEAYRHAYITLNTVRGDLRAAASAGDVERRRHLLTDFDPVRPSGTNATAEELQAAAAVAATFVSTMHAQHGWPIGFTAWSGNGVHVVYPIDIPNDDASTRLVRAVLQRFARDFNTDAVKVDTAVFDAPRIVRLWGTVNRKSVTPTADRPHRLSGAWPGQIGPFAVVPREVLERYAGPFLEAEPVHPVGSTAVAASSGSWAELPSDEQARIVEELRSALAHCDADDRAEWVAVGQALRSLGEAGYQLWAAWSATSARFPGGQGLDQWNSFRAERTGYPAIFERAQQRGWKNPRALDTGTLGFGVATPNGAQPQSVPRVSMPYGDVRDGTDQTLPLTQYGNALRLRNFTSRADGVPLLHHVFEKKFWIKWMAHAWCHSDAAEVRHLALSQLPKLIYQEGFRFLAQDFKPFAEFARKSSEGHHAAGTVEILGGMPEIRRKASELDADPCAIGLDRGRLLLDLRSGQVRATTPEWAAAGSVDTLLRWKIEPGVVYGNETEFQPGVQGRGSQAGDRTRRVDRAGCA